MLDLGPYLPYCINDAGLVAARAVRHHYKHLHLKRRNRHVGEHRFTGRDLYCTRWNERSGKGR